MHTLAPSHVDTMTTNSGALLQSPSDASIPSSPSIKRLKRQTIPDEQRQFRKIQQAAMAGKYRHADYLARRYFSSRSACLAAMIEANAGLKKHRRLSKTELLEIAEGLNAFKGTSEEVTLLGKAKKNNNCDFRIVYRFDVRHRALQIMVRRVLQARVQLHPQQYLLQGAGTPPAAPLSKLFPRGSDTRRRSTSDHAIPLSIIGRSARCCPFRRKSWKPW